MDDREKDDLKGQSALSRAFHSIRTRYSLATAVFLLAILAMFYIGGRIVLVHFVRDAEKQVQGIGINIGKLVNRDADRLRRSAAHAARRFDGFVAEGTACDTVKLMDELFGPDISLALRLDGNGKFLEGCTSGAGGALRRLAVRDVEPYTRSFAAWATGQTASNEVLSAGLMDIDGRMHYGALARCHTGGYLLIGTLFDMTAFTARMNESLSGMEIRMHQKPSATDMPVAIGRRPAGTTAPKRHSFGIMPMVSEAINFYSGGFWEFGSSPLEATFTIRDIAGTPLSVIAVSLPRTFSSATSVALSRLTFFITMAGILLILPIFWFQSQLLLNPLTQMIERIRQVGERHNDVDCPRLEWSGKDEFAQLAVSVNRMLETISRRSLAIAQSEARQKAMIASIPDGLVVFDQRHRAVSIVKQPDDVPPIPGMAEGEPLSEAVYGEDGVKAASEALDAIFESGGTRHMHLSTADGAEKTREFELRLSRLDDFFAMAAIRDTTAENAERRRLRAAELRLVRAHKQESMAQLATGIAHDVNNVLAVVLNTLEITWMDGAEDDPIVASALATIRDAVKRGSGMMHELMTFAGETKIALRRCDPAELARASSRLTEGTLGANVILSYDLPVGLPPVDADPDQFWKVFFNLTKNAAEAMAGRPGEITISARAFDMSAAMATTFTSSRALQPGPGVLFLVADNGPGIPPDLARRIFDPYVSTKSAGRGLGLAIVASIVASHGGGISVRSGTMGGTTFSIFLPASKLPAETEEPSPASPETPGEVLLVDDDEGIRKTTAILLKTLKHKPLLAGDADTALAVFRRFAPRLSCVILDANLGNFDALRLIRAFRLANPNVPVIVSSGSPAEEIADRFKSQPYNAFLAKPYTLAELKDALAHAAAARR